MRMIKCLVTVAAAAVAVSSGTSPAVASATVSRGPVKLAVEGSGLKVDRATIYLDGWGKATQGRLYAIAPGGRTEHDIRNVTGWKKLRQHRAALRKYRSAAWKLHRRFPTGTRLCAQVTTAWEEPCATIHR